MLPDEVREALDALASDVFDGHVAAKRNVQTIRAHLLARDAEVERLTEDRDSQQRAAIAALARAERAEALLREVAAEWEQGGMPISIPLHDSITAHLSENSRG